MEPPGKPQRQRDALGPGWHCRLHRDDDCAGNHFLAYLIKMPICSHTAGCGFARGRVDDAADHYGDR
jgi:hypothetical protein